MKTDKTDNELIAEFMGFERYGDNSFKCPNVGNDYAYGWTTFKPEELTFSDRWDSLMPVVEKIETMRYDFRIHSCWTWGNGEYVQRNYVEVLGQPNESIVYQEAKTPRTKLESVYSAVVEFIKWYNSKDL